MPPTIRSMGEHRQKEGQTFSEFMADMRVCDACKAWIEACPGKFYEAKWQCDECAKLEKESAS